MSSCVGGPIFSASIRCESRKVAAIAQFIVHLAPSEAVQFAIVDGKGGADYEDVVGRCFASAGDDLMEANRIFQRVRELRR